MPDTADQPGVGRARRTTRRVYLQDRLAEGVISIGGIGVLTIVLGIGVYLVLVALPLFRVGSSTPAASLPGAPALMPIVDPYGVCLVGFDGTGAFHALHGSSGRQLGRWPVAEGADAPTASSLHARSGLVALGFSDGGVRLGSVTFDIETDASGVWAAAGTLAPGESGVLVDEPGVVYERTEAGPVRRTTPVVDLDARTSLRDTAWGASPVRIVDYRRVGSRELALVVWEDARAVLTSIRTTRPLGGGSTRRRFTSSDVRLPPGDPPTWAFALDGGDEACCVWPDGRVERLVRDDSGVIGPCGDTIRLTDARPTAAMLAIGSRTLVVGDERGRITTVFAAEDSTAGASDGRCLVTGLRERVTGEPITCLAPSLRDRSLIAGDADGAAVVLHATSGKIITRVHAGAPARGVALTPKLDGLVVTTGAGVGSWSMDPQYPEVTWRTLFAPVRYEGELDTGFVYQSSAGDDATEVKISLLPMIFGTIKATVVAIFFAAPLAVLAAIYTSEFLNPRLKRVVKPTIEMMASLPSVVLGFVAAIVVAPLIRDSLPGVLAGFVVVPSVVVLAACAWQLLPTRIMNRPPTGVRLVLTLAVVVLGGVISLAVGPALERVAFRPTHADTLVAGGSFEPAPRAEWPTWVGRRTSMSPDEERRLRSGGLFFRDGGVVRAVEPAPGQREEVERRGAAVLAGLGPPMRAWLDGAYGPATPGWAIVLFPPMAVLIVITRVRLADRAIAGWLADKPRSVEAMMGMVKLAVTLAGGGVLSLAIGSALSAAGLDTRDSFFGPFTQRNALVVGVIMGFAVIPIIYTISEDALASVPDSLRSASLGSGATPWQTAVRVVLPVALSGIFSATMIGLGRAVGETMIVLMATGNTPTMDWNLFSGFRTLAANIAVELPEAPKDSAHYRVLFLCGLVLFTMTFIVNTTAEVVRQRFRKRNAAL